MATLTPNYHLIKPEASDYINIRDLNANMDIVDAAFHAIDPDTEIPDVADVLEHIDAMEEATEAANAAATKAVRYDDEQSLTSAQQQTARDNVGAASAEELTDLQTNFMLAQTTQPAAASNKIWINTGTSQEITVPEINDTAVSETDTWSSAKIDAALQSVTADQPLRGKKVNWIGDDAFYGGGTDGNHGWIGRIASQYGCTFESLARNGAVMIDPESSSYYSIALQCTTFTEADPDYVIFSGGANDGLNRVLSPLGIFDALRYDQPTDKTISFSSAFEYVIWQLLTAYPDAKIGYVIPYKQISYNAGTDTFDMPGAVYYDRAIEICEKWGIPYLDLRKRTPLNYQVTALRDKFTDMMHINGSGYDLTYDIVANWMKIL